METRFTVNGRHVVATRKQVETALRGVAPQKVRVHSVEIGHRVYPVRQALAVAFDLNPADCFPQVASRVFRQLGFETAAKPGRPRTRARHTWAVLHEALPHRTADIGPVYYQGLELLPIALGWFEWERWQDLAEYGQAIIDLLPRRSPGVYEARLKGEEERLTIGRASDLRARILHGLIYGTSQHSSGRKIREHEDVRQVLVRWAVTDRPAAAEEELHRLHVAEFGHLPKYTLRT